MSDELEPCAPDFLEDAITMVREAAALAMDGWQQDDLGVDQKGDGTPVTLYDRLVEATLRKAIADRHPGDAVLGEEDEDLSGTTGRRWIIDPIDGTHPYSRRVVTWGTLVGCEDERGSLVGVVACPWVGERGEVVAAGRGLGATWNGVPARASERDQVRGALVSTSSLRHWPDGALERVLAAGAHVVTWGNAYGMALAATGRVDAFFDDGIKPWDLGPAPVLMSEAGGRFGALDGSTAIDRGNGLCASTELFEPLRRLLTGS